MSWKSWYALWCCRGCVVIVALFVDFWWSVKISWGMAVFEQQDGAVVGLSWPFLSGLASSPLGMSNAHFRL